MRRPRDSGSKWILPAILVGLLALPFALRPRSGQEATEAEPQDLPVKKLVCVSPHWEGIRWEFTRAFSRWTAKHLGHRTEIDWLDVGGTSDCLRYVRSEFSRSPDGINVDLFFGGGIDPYLQLAEEGRLSPCKVSPEVLATFPPTVAGIEVYDPQQRWFGACLSGFGIIYNRKVLDIMALPEPITWAHLALPEYRSWVGSGDPRSSGSVHMAYEIILQAYGWREGWANIARMGGNIRNFARGGSDVPKDAAVGEIACGMAIDVYAWRQVAEVGTNRMGFVLPDGLTVLNPDAMAVLKGAPERELAEHFVEFVVSEHGQKLWVLKAGVPGGPQRFPLTRMSIVPGFAQRFGDDAAVAFDAYTWKGGFQYDAEKGSARWTILNDLIGAAVIDTHQELIAAWDHVRHLPENAPGVVELTRPPLSEDELLEMAAGPWSDPEFRARTRGRWASEAKHRYRQIADR